MINKLTKKRKKKGFTLIELVIVLAVLAIIALIAIPNFTKVRNDSLEKADARTMEQIEKITLMAIANQDVPATTLTFNIKDSKIDGAASGVEEDNYNAMIKEVKNPQVNGAKGYQVKINGDGSVEVTTITS